MGKKHANRWMNVRCSAVDLTEMPHVHYPSGKYTYKYPSDDLRYMLIGQAIAKIEGIKIFLLRLSLNRRTVCKTNDEYVADVFQ